MDAQFNAAQKTWDLDGLGKLWYTLQVADFV